MDGMEKVLEEIKKERERQESHWGTDFDDKNTLNDWVAYIMIKAGQAASMFSSPEKQRENLLKTAAWQLLLVKLLIATMDFQKDIMRTWLNQMESLTKNNIKSKKDEVLQLRLCVF